MIQINKTGAEHYPPFLILLFKCLSSIKSVFCLMDSRGVVVSMVEIFSKFCVIVDTITHHKKKNLKNAICMQKSKI